MFFVHYSPTYVSISGFPLIVTKPIANAARQTDEGGKGDRGMLQSSLVISVLSDCCALSCYVVSTIVTPLSLLVCSL